MLPAVVKTWIQSIGCQMSVHDGQRIGESLFARGYLPASSIDEADVVVLTTCSVREKARQKVLSAIGRFKRLKERRPSLVVVVAGCVAQQEGERLLEDAPHVDLVIGPDHLWRIPGLVEEIKDGGPARCLVGFDEPDHRRFLGRAGSAASGVSAYLTIQKGCDEGCAFCIVPLVRGPSEHRPVPEVLQEAEALSRAGAREVILLGQTVNSYRCGDVGFAGLLALLDAVPGIERVRYESAHPRFVTDELLDAHSTLPSLCEHLHVPVQSGSDTVLARMGRGHIRGDFVAWSRRLREVGRGIGISTDLFVGFPGETEAEFRDTLSLVEEVRFDASYSFKYSPRPGTPAASLPDDVPPDVKADRLRRLQDLQARITSEALSGLVGTVVEVLVEGESRSGDGQLTGRSRRNTVVNIDGCDASPGAPVRPGDLVNVMVTHAGSHSVRGRAEDGSCAKRGA
jgi:tRNA-2-methylthio-N6-dimethylallyladenosine synthase